MKYFKSRYFVAAPKEKVFERVLNISLMQEKIGLFENAEVDQSFHEIDQVGKQYYIKSTANSVSICVTLTLQSCNKPNGYCFKYTYKTFMEDGELKQYCPFLAWDTMTCIVSLKQLAGGTEVEMQMLAHGVNSLFKQLYTKALGYINYIQQLKYNKRIVRYLNNELL